MKIKLKLHKIFIKTIIYTSHVIYLSNSEVTYARKSIRINVPIKHWYIESHKHALYCHGNYKTPKEYT